MAASCSRRSRMSCSSPIVCPCSTSTSPRRVRVVMVGDAVPRLFAKLGGGLGLEGQVGVPIQLIGDQAEEDLADPRRGEDRAELLIDRARRA